MKIPAKILAFMSLLLVSGCFGSYYEPEPVGVGKGVNELKPVSYTHLTLPTNCT